MSNSTRPRCAGWAPVSRQQPDLVLSKPGMVEVPEICEPLKRDRLDWFDVAALPDATVPTCRRRSGGKGAAVDDGDRLASPLVH